MTHAEVEMTAELVRDLLRDQHPDLADRTITLGARGWDNQLWRLGADLAVRLPWATESADALSAFLTALHQPAPAGAPAGRGANEAAEADAATRRRARGLAAVKAVVGILIGDAGDHGRPGGKPTWGPPAHAALRRLVATASQVKR